MNSYLPRIFKRIELGNSDNEKRKEIKKYKEVLALVGDEHNFAKEGHFISGRISDKNDFDGYYFKRADGKGGFAKEEFLHYHDLVELLIDSKFF